MKHTIREELSGVMVFVGVLWAVYAIDWILPWQLTAWGLVPRTLGGLLGIVTMPFLHGGLGHLLSNSIPLVILLSLLAGSRTRTWPSVIEIALLGGGLLWLLGRSNNHVGASGLVYGLITFLIVSGFRERRIVPMGVAILVGFLYGGTLLTGVLPTVGPGVSWDGHLFGAIAGGIVGFLTLSPSGNDNDAMSKTEPVNDQAVLR